MLDASTVPTNRSAQIGRFSNIAISHVMYNYHVDYSKKHERQFKLWTTSALKARPLDRRGQPIKNRWSPLPTEGYRVSSALARGGSWRTARVANMCDGCRGWIVPDDTYLDTALRRPGTIESYRLCLGCAYKG